jgi:hypothetical protein
MQITAVSARVWPESQAGSNRMQQTGLASQTNPATNKHTRGQAHDGVLRLLVYDGGHAAGRPAHLPALARVKLDVVDGHADRDVLRACVWHVLMLQSCARQVGSAGMKLHDKLRHSGSQPRPGHHRVRSSRLSQLSP